MMALPDVSSVVSRVKTTIARVQDPEVVGFAAGDDAKGALRYLETNCQEIIYLGNARRALASHNADGYSKAVVNLRAAKTLYDNAAKSGTDKSLSAFYSALSERTDAVASGIDLLQDCFSENAALDFDKIAERASHLADLCEGSAVKADQCGRDARDTVPASEGARADAAALRVFAKIVKLYGVADPNRSASFRAYLDNCQALASGAKTNDRSLRWLDEFTNHLTMMLSAMSGQTRLPVVNRFDWAQAKADAGASSSLFGGKETSTIERRIFVPFWLARLCASEQQGLIFKKGRQVEGQLLLDASKAGAGFVRADESLAATVQNALMSRAGFDGSDVIAPAVGKLDASKRLKEIIQSTPELAGAHANLVEIVYLPAACVKYSGKKGTRTASVHFVDAGATSLSPVAKQLGRHHICVAT
jgi:hypothetical protein